ncbi:aspartate aminotransferase family protein [Bacillus sp. 165]|uniref:pyridoxal phosphate-dependent decarboxylase family protein n=1 Tax=Bacillus sp. 165 TaxID=1529117 RepID=UPI001ADCC277|nr:aspartate aminotransferase family protein [Bacillus sp. 165]MBO9128548.1 aspartate aminotransferase family protein [Bacillus sp. 165]
MNSSIPEKGRPYEEILEELDRFGKDDPLYKEGKTWSLVYYLDKEYTKFLEDAYAKYFSANGLNPTAFKSLKRLEKEVLKFTAELFHVDDNACGVMTSGGTESCLLAVKTYRDLGRAKGIKKPEMIIPETAHVAWDKGAEYFGVKIRRAPLASDYGVDVDAVKKRINKNTIMILGSAPEYPHGIIDPIEQLGELAQKHDIPLHVDACVGGYILPFIEANGTSLPLWDFRVPGVTSISADIHKYGFAAKGASCILYRNIDYFKYQIFVNEDWPGGVFASPALLGTRPGGAYAAAWASIQANGREGYMELARRTMNAVNKLTEGIRAIDGLDIIGNPQASLISYRSTKPDLNIFAVGDVMEQKGWLIDRIQRPDALHAMVIASHDKIIDQYLADLKDAVATVLAHPELGETGQAATYGMISHIPLRKLVKNQIAQMFANSYKLNAKEIDLTDHEGLAPGTEATEHPSNKKEIVQGLLNWYVKRKMKQKSN